MCLSQTIPVSINLNKQLKAEPFLQKLNKIIDSCNALVT